jgi:hypothetical protein
MIKLLIAMLKEEKIFIIMIVVGAICLGTGVLLGKTISIFETGIANGIAKECKEELSILQNTIDNKLNCSGE